MEDNKEDKIEYAGFWIRLMATALDVFIVGLPVMLFVSILFGLDWLLGNSINWRADLLNFILIAAVTIILWANWRGMTPGKKLMGIRIVSFPDYQALSYGKSAVRCLIGYTISTLILFLGYLMIAFRKDKRGLHDLIAKTCVIYDK